MPVISLPSDLDQWPTVVDDQRLAEAEERVRDRFPQFPDDIRFASVIQPPKVASGGVLPEMAVFLAVFPHPKRPGVSLMTSATASYADWVAWQAEYEHFVGVPDPLEGVMVTIAVQALASIESLKQLIE